MKLSEWAKQIGLSYKTALRLWQAGQLSVPAFQLEAGSIVDQHRANQVMKALHG